MPEIKSDNFIYGIRGGLVLDYVGNPVMKYGSGVGKGGRFTCYTYYTVK